DDHRADHQHDEHDQRLDVPASRDLRDAPWACHDQAGKGVPVRYLIVAEAYRDLEQIAGRLVLTERLAALLAQTPAGLLPTVCYLCQGLIAPEFAGVD